jgi:hypothetical protein
MAASGVRPGEEKSAMSRSRYFSICFLALAGSFAGGYTANRAIPVAHAQVQLPPMEVRGSSFTLTNPQGQAQATLKNGANGAELALNDPRGNVRVELSPDGGLIIRDQTGHITWRSPRGNGIIPLSAR